MLCDTRRLSGGKARNRFFSLIASDFLLLAFLTLFREIQGYTFLTPTHSSPHHHISYSHIPPTTIISHFMVSAKRKSLRKDEKNKMKTFC